MVTVLNALSVDPGRKWKGAWRYYTEEFLDCCMPLDVVEREGINFSNLACLARCNGLSVEEVHGDQVTLDEFRSRVASLCKRDDKFIAVCYSRKTLNQTGDGHWSPIGACDSETDSVLILDQARFKYNAHWVPLSVLYEAMNTMDSEGNKRGFFQLSKSRELIPGRLLSLCVNDDSPEFAWGLQNRLMPVVKQRFAESKNIRDTMLVAADMLEDTFTNRWVDDNIKDMTCCTPKRVKVLDDIVAELFATRTGEVLISGDKDLKQAWRIALVMSLDEQFWVAAVGETNAKLFFEHPNSGQLLVVELNESRLQLRSVLNASNHL